MIFINTAPPDDIIEMEDDCEELYTGGLLQRYAKRHFSPQHLTLADWAAWCLIIVKL